MLRARSSFHNISSLFGFERNRYQYFITTHLFRELFEIGANSNTQSSLDLITKFLSPEIRQRQQFPDSRLSPDLISDLRQQSQRNGGQGDRAGDAAYAFLADDEAGGCFGGDGEGDIDVDGGMGVAFDGRGDIQGI